VAEELRARGWRVVWMGNPEGMEARIVPPRGYDTAWVRFGALRGKGLLRKLLLPVNLLLRLLAGAARDPPRPPRRGAGHGRLRHLPGRHDGRAARAPLVLHEQNSVAGLANRVLARVADRVLSGFPEVLEQAEWMGNPVRAEIAAVLPPAERTPDAAGPLRVLVVGGSLGAAVLNETVPQALLRLPAEQRPVVVHQAGERQIEACARRTRAPGRRGAAPLHRRHGGAYADADLVICRAGALTVAELAAAGVASLWCPSPRGGRPPDRQRALPRRPRRRLSAAAIRTNARPPGGRLLQS
jgi:UDP-N-acetylglucosamine--N-acetylmuramyl-(pentapeptide) pyrophosphoryl-undecaprenol N-acetylglucosamine transferase